MIPNRQIKTENLNCKYKVQIIDVSLSLVFPNQNILDLKNDLAQVDTMKMSNQNINK